MLATPAMQDAEDVLMSAINTYRRANAECAYYALRLLALRVQQVLPQATTFVLDWSDQGDYLTVSAVLDSGGGDVEFDYEQEPDPDMWAGNLSESNESTWLALCKPEPVDDTPRVMRPSPTYHFVIDKVLAATAEPYKEG